MSAVVLPTYICSNSIVETAFILYFQMSAYRLYGYSSVQTLDWFVFCPVMSYRNVDPARLGEAGALFSGSHMLSAMATVNVKCNFRHFQRKLHCHIHDLSNL